MTPDLYYITPKNKCFKDLSCKKFDRLSVLRYAGKKNNKNYWLCKCECGKETIVVTHCLTSGHTKSCGCLKNDTKSNLIHGERVSSEYSIWCGIKNRCNNKNVKAYPKYGGRGITLCERWNDYLKFKEDMGPRPSSKHSIDRIDVNGNYCPENCRWATSKEQMNNTRVNLIIEYNGEIKTLAEWSEKIGIKYSTLLSRYNDGFSIEDILTKPVDSYSPYKEKRKDYSICNKRIFIEHDGEKLSPKEFSLKYNIPITVVRKRYKEGYTSEEIINTPVISHREQLETQYLEHAGQNLTISEWSEKLGISRNTLISRKRQGKSIEDILNPVVQQKRKG